MKRYLVKTTPEAKADLVAAAEWWSENRSERQAEAWYEGISRAIASLEVMPYRCSKIFGVEFGTDVRVLRYGVSSTPTHRVYFTIDEDSVVVLRVLSMREQQPDDTGGLST